MSIYRIAMIARLAVFCLPAFFCGVQSGFAGSLDFSSGDTVTVSAERAWEADEADVIHFSGRFELRAPDWCLFGDTAVVYGNLDNPDRVVVEGKPARISFLRDAEGDVGSPESRERVDGWASFVEYFRATDKLLMRGEAKLTRKESTLVSEVIEYDVDADRYSAGGEGGINILLNTDDY
jgi:lipopolysaccharide transport protein LptA